MPPTERRVLFTDWDGTVTRHDVYRLVLDALPLDVEEDPWQAFREGRATHFEALARIFGGIRADAATFDALLDRARPDPHLAEDLDALARAGWEVHVVTAGCDLYIRRLLARAGVRRDVPVHGNAGYFVPGGGLRMTRAHDPRLREETVGIDKAAVIRHLGAGATRVAFAGDSLPDLAAARLVDAKDRFARASLAAALEEEGLPYRPFEAWHDVVETLLR